MIRAALPLLVLTLLGCQIDDVVATQTTSADGGQRDGGNPPVQEALGCDATRPLIRTAASGSGFGACTCGSSVLAGGVTTDGSARFGPLRLEAPANIGAGLWVSGSLSADGDADVRAREVLVDGAITSDAEISVQRSVWAGADVRAVRLVAPEGLVVPPGVNVDVDDLLAAEEAGPPVTAADCSCDPDAELAAAIEAAATPWNDEALELGGAVAVPCGARAVERWTVSEATTVQVEGATQLLVRGDFSIQGELTIDIEPGARLDLVVMGNLVSSQRLGLGAADQPVSLAVLGSGTVQLSAGGQVFGDVVLPQAQLVVSAPLEITGTLRVASVSASAPITVRGTPAVDTGGACATDLDCVPPAICQGGCVAE